MKRLIFLAALFCSIGLSAQRTYSIDGVAKRFSTALGIPVKASSFYNTSSDTAIIFFDPTDTSTIFFKYKGITKKLAPSNVQWDSIAGKPTNFSTTNTAQNITSVKTFDSTQIFTKRAIISPSGQSYYQVTGVAEDGPALFINQSITNASSVNEHGIIDRSTFSRSGKAYNSYDAQAILNGSNNLDHYAGFQSRGSMQLTGATLSNYYNFLSAPDLTSGTVNKLYHFINFSTTGTGAGGANEEYGFYAKPMVKGTRKYAFYSESDSSFFGNQVEALSFKKTSSTNAKILLGAGSDIDTSTLLAGRWLPNRSLDTATALQSRIQTKQPLLGFTAKDFSDTLFTTGYTTRARTKQQTDSIIGLISSLGGGTVLSVATNNGTGITGGTIISTGTLAIDTATTISTKANVTALLLGKQNNLGFTPIQFSDSATLLAGRWLPNRSLDTATALQSRIQTKQPLLTNPITGTGTSGQVAYWNGTSTQTGSSNFVWDNSNLRLVLNDLRLTATDITSGLKQVSYYPNSGTNIGASISAIPRGTGFSSELRAQFSLFNTDFIADATNYEFATYRSTSDRFLLATGKSGTGTLRPLVFSAGGVSDAPANLNQVHLFTDGLVGINTGTNNGVDNVQVNGSLIATTLKSTTNTVSGNSTIGGTLGVTGAQTNSSSVKATSFILGNGQYIRLTRNSGALEYDAFGIVSGTDNTRIVSTGDFDVVNGSLTSLFKVGSSGAITASSTTASTSTTTGALVVGGGVGIGGAVWASSGFFESDERLKNILYRNNFADGFDVIKYTWKNQGIRGDKTHWGYSAQSILKVLPEAVSIGENGMMGVDYNSVHTYEIMQLKNRIAQLEKQLNK